MTQNNPKPEFFSDNHKQADRNPVENKLLVEVAWEVANQVGGIYTVIRSKVPSMQENWGDNYLLLGPYVHPNVSAIFEPYEDENDVYARVVKQMREGGMEVHYGRWLITGRPKVVLFNPFSVYDRLGEIKYLLWEHHDISLPGEDDLLNQVVAFGWMVKMFLTILSSPETNANMDIIAHVHEWMAATAIPEIRRDNLPIRTVFTTHATMLGRYLAMNDPHFYEHLPFYNWQDEAQNFNIETTIRIERAAAHGAHVLTTVSEVTGKECEFLLGRKPDVILPNGLNIKRRSVAHEIQNIHQRCKDEIHNFVMGHFFQSHYFDLEKTLYFFTSGRYEYRNKGYDLTLEALARLNWRMKEANIDKTVVMFFITKRPFHSINPNVLQSKATMEKMRQTCEDIQQQVGERLFSRAYSSQDPRFPDVNAFIDDNLKLKLRRNLQIWKTRALPSIVTHNLVDDSNDEILNFLRSSNLLNHESDRVKIVYHPDFVSATSPLLGLEYGDFVRGCHLGIFPSHYEPWGYTPLECMASGVAGITSDLAGFGDYIQRIMPNTEENGMYVVNRKDRSFDEAANQLTDQLFSFLLMSRNDRIAQRYRLETASEIFAWKNLTSYYQKAYEKALEVKV